MRATRRALVAFGLGAALAGGASFAASPRMGDPKPAGLTPGSVNRGREIYEDTCFACHSLDANRVGPAHRGVFGRKAGSAPGFAYSVAVKSSGVVWSETTLDTWLMDPQTFIPGARMGFHLSDAQKRADVIAYLKYTTGKPGSR